MYSLLIPIIAMVVNVGVQISTFRHRRGARFLGSILTGFTAGLLALASLQTLYLSRRTDADGLVVAILVNLPIYFGLGYCYYNFAQLGQSSIRVRLFSEIAARPSGMSVEEVAQEYCDKSLVAARLHRLVESQDISSQDDRYRVRRKRFIYIGNVLLLLKQFLIGKASQFE